MCLSPLMPSPLTHSTWQIIFNSSHVSPLPGTLGTAPPQGCRHHSPDGVRAVGPGPSHPCHPIVGWTFCWLPYWAVNFMRAAGTCCMLVPLCVPCLLQHRTDVLSSSKQCLSVVRWRWVGGGGDKSEGISFWKPKPLCSGSICGKYKLLPAHLAFHALRLAWGSQLELLFDSISPASQLRKQLS